MQQAFSDNDPLPVPSLASFGPARADRMRQVSRRGPRIARCTSLCEEVQLNLVYRRFCRLGLDGDVPDHSRRSIFRRITGTALTRSNQLRTRHLSPRLLQECAQDIERDARRVRLVSIT
jgi:hypothetical protein